MEPLPQTTDKAKEKEGVLLEDVWYFGGHRHNVHLTATGIKYWKVRGGRRNFVPFKEILGVPVPTQTYFHILCVTPKNQTGQRKTYTLSFETYQKPTSPSHWATLLRKLLAKLRPPLKKLLFYVNPYSGQKAALEVWEAAKDLLHVAEVAYEVVFTERAGHAQAHVQGVRAGEYGGCVCVSGDGLLFEVVNGIMARPDYCEVLAGLPLGIVPAGSGNGLAASLLAPDVVTATYAIICGEWHPLDAYSVIQNDQRRFGFLSISWATMSVIDLESDSYRWLGPLRFDLKGVSELLTCNAYKGIISYIPAPEETTPTLHQLLPEDPKALPPLRYIGRPDLPWKVVKGEWSFFCAALTPRVSVSPGAFAEKAHISDGTIDLIFAPSVGRLDLAAILTSIEDGTIAKCPKVNYVKVVAFKLEPCPDIKNKNVAPISLDGEHAPSSLVSVEVHQGLYKVFHDFEEGKPTTTNTDSEPTIEDIYDLPSPRPDHDLPSPRPDQDLPSPRPDLN
eukprot:TRINITY_DN8883_c0_g1_i1.p1 TRINITY_DN8883_c0_g1~~TRINITY_DN8883_c0_g1_i1.p1  ORF type:complete len:505 (-),score=111.74 TRINITY_DN8883_c0_g1_i1:13-1527(-)